jgi:hypothetical protein
MTNIIPMRRRRPRRTPQATPVILGQVGDTAPIERFREIVSQARNSLLVADGPVHPDTELLDLCAEALHLLVSAREALDAYQAQLAAATEVDRHSPRYRQLRAAGETFLDKRHDLIRRAKAMMSRARKISAQTGPGVYAKALLVRDSSTGAPGLAKSLAEDLIRIPRLRESLWDRALSTDTRMPS